MGKGLEQADNKRDLHEIKRFFREAAFLAQIDNVARVRLNSSLAQDFSVFTYINPDENILSDIIKNLLNPKGTHGQGALFLDLFLEHCNISRSSIETVKLKRESRTTHISKNLRRIDIFIHLDREIAVAIENKPWACDQSDQIVDYARHLERLYKKYYIVYMPGSFDREPSIDSNRLQKLKDEGRYISFPYNTHCKTWLTECRTKCEAEKVRFFLKDFINWIDSNFRSEI